MRCLGFRAFWFPHSILCFLPTTVPSGQVRYASHKEHHTVHGCCILGINIARCALCLCWLNRRAFNKSFSEQISFFKLSFLPTYDTKFPFSSTSIRPSKILIISARIPDPESYRMIVSSELYICREVRGSESTSCYSNRMITNENPFFTYFVGLQDKELHLHRL